MSVLVENLAVMGVSHGGYGGRFIRSTDPSLTIAAGIEWDKDLSSLSTESVVKFGR